MSEGLPYRRVLAKISGEALAGDQGFGIDPVALGRIADDVAAATAMGVMLAVVVGGGNLFRGAWLAARGADRVVADQMGMLATVTNGLALREALAARGLDAELSSGFPVPQACQTYSPRAARAAFRAGRTLVLAGGTGSPFFTTDTAATLRACELGCEAVLKATKVDGVYSADPHEVRDAVRYDRLTFDEALHRGLAVMDVAAFALARDNGIPIIVFSIHEPRALVEVLSGRGRFTLVTP